MACSAPARVSWSSTAYRQLARIAHPDLTGGEHDQMARLNAARDAALMDLSR
jgi:hypothetical protein